MIDLQQAPVAVQSFPEAPNTVRFCASPAASEMRANISNLEILDLGFL